MDSHTSADSCISRLLSHLNIHASGGPTLSQPLELFYPQHRFYPRHTIRLVPSEAARDETTLSGPKGVPLADLDTLLTPGFASFGEASPGNLAGSPAALKPFRGESLRSIV